MLKKLVIGSLFISSVALAGGVVSYPATATLNFGKFGDTSIDLENSEAIKFLAEDLGIKGGEDTEKEVKFKVSCSKGLTSCTLTVAE